MFLGPRGSHSHKLFDVWVVPDDDDFPRTATAMEASWLERGWIPGSLL